MLNEDDPFCCIHCFADGAIKAYFEAEGEQGSCGFCNSTDTLVLPVSTVAEFLDTGIDRKYEDAGNTSCFESREEGYQGATLHIEEILRDEEIFEHAPQCVDPPLSEVLAECSSHSDTALVVQHQFSGPGDYIEMWEAFCDETKYSSRFTVFMHYSEQARARLSVDDRPNDLALDSYRLTELWHHIDETLSEFVREIPSGQKLYRARISQAGIELTHEQLTSPPRDKTRNSRMSPVGISYFYGAEDADTCIAEIRPHVGSEVTIAEFRTTESLKILDLVDLPPPVSLFDGNRHWFELEEFMKPFLSEFSILIAQPISPGDELLEYVPTQVFCEFIKNNYWRIKIDGIRYRSALREGGASIVLFRGGEISLGPKPWLGFRGSSRLKISGITHQYGPADEDAGANVFAANAMPKVCDGDVSP